VLLVLVVVSCAPPVEPAAQEEVSAADKYADRYSAEQLAWVDEIRTAYSGTTLNMLGFAHPTLNAMKAITPEWEELTGITIVYDETDLAKVRDKFVLDITSGANSYDLVMTAEVQAPEYWNLDYLEPLDSWLNNEMEVNTESWFDWEDLHSGYTMMFTSVNEGKRYAVPISGEVALLFYRTDIFEELGLEVPATYDEMLATAKLINDQEIVEEGRTVHGVSFRGRPALGGGNWIWSIIIFPFGGQIVDLDDQVTPAVLEKKDAAVAAIAWETEMAKHGVPGIASFDPYDAINQYKQGFAAMSIEASVLSPGVLNPEESIVTDLTGFAPLPAGPAGSFNQTFAHGVAITATSGNKGAAYAFMQWMLGRANQDLLLENGGAPVRRSAMEDPANQERWPYIEATLQGLDQASAAYEQRLFATPQVEFVLEYLNVWSVNVSRAIANEISAEQAAENIQSEMEEILAQK
jgi:multiple sugar transport system substrate-binding protein